jgi:hypothetical protein
VKPAAQHRWPTSGTPHATGRRKLRYRSRTATVDDHV